MTRKKPVVEGDSKWTSARVLRSGKEELDELHRLLGDRAAPPLSEPYASIHRSVLSDMGLSADTLGSSVQFAIRVAICILKEPEK